jgi:hypothetical protein
LGAQDQALQLKQSSMNFIRVRLGAPVKIKDHLAYLERRFCSDGSKVSKYTIVDATPFQSRSAGGTGRGLPESRHYPLLLLLPNAGLARAGWHGNTWDWPDESKKNFTRYLEDKVKPQVRELLTDYGPIGLIWFDTPRVITREQSLELAALVHKLQADCIVSGRIGHDAGESSSSGNARTTGSIWDFKVTSPGAYDVVLVSSEQKYGGRRKEARRWPSTRRASRSKPLWRTTERKRALAMRIGRTYYLQLNRSRCRPHRSSESRWYR